MAENLSQRTFKSLDDFRNALLDLKDHCFTERPSLGYEPDGSPSPNQASIFQAWQWLGRRYNKLHALSVPVSDPLISDIYYGPVRPKGSKRATDVRPMQVRKVLVDQAWRREDELLPAPPIERMRGRITRIISDAQLLLEDFDKWQR